MIPLKDDHSLHRFPLITVAILLLNVYSFSYQASLGEGKYEFWRQYGTIPWEITHNSDQPPSVDFPVRWTLISSMFLHADWLHLLGNLFYLWIFAKGVEDSMGYLRFTIFYLLCGVIASLSHILTAPDSPIPAIGASGAISGMLGAYLVLHPTANILTIIVLPGTLIRILPVPAFLFLLPWIILQVAHGTECLQVGGCSGIAWFAHIGGFAAGLVLAHIFKHD